MRAKPSANAAMAADNRLPRFRVEVDGTHNASGLALPAADTLFRNKQDAASVTKFKGIARAYFHARRLKACKANDSDVTAIHTTRCPHFNSALDK